jgi:DNA polymerase III sliding clamp (beta) subunit (PCNA family)
MKKKEGRKKRRRKNKMQREEMKISSVNLIYSNPKRLSKILKLTHMLRDEVNVTIDGEGISYKCMDSSHISMLVVKIPMITDISEGSIEIPLNLDEMVKKVFQKVDNAERVSFGVDLSAKNLLVMFQGGLEKCYCLKLYEPVEENVPMPKLDFTVSLTINSKVLYDIVKELDMISYLTTIQAKDGRITFSAELGDISNIIAITKGSEGVLNIEETCNAQSIYNLNYLTPIIKEMSGIAKEIELKFAQNHPLMLRIQPGEGEFVEYYLAPRVPDN